MDFENLTPGKIFLGMIVGIVVLGGAFTTVLVGYGFWSGSIVVRKDAAPVDPYAADRLRDDVLAYLAQPRFAGRDLERQILGDAQLELLQLDDREVYLSMPKSVGDEAGARATVAAHVNDVARVEFARDEGGRLQLGKYSLARHDEKYFFLKTQVDNVKIDPEQVLTFRFERGEYSTSLKELADFVSNRSIFGGYLNADTGRRRGDRHVVFSNHGALVARRGEPSLDRFAHALVADVAEGAQARELRVQRLLDLVTNEIEYDKTEAVASYETLKRPNEVLMSRRSDCSNKAILFGSLLEQLGEDYLFLYAPEHITVAVRKGNFPTTNRLTFDWEGDEWLIAEPTAAGFEIGTTRLRDEAVFRKIEFVQRPWQRDVIVDTKTGEKIAFR